MNSFRDYAILCGRACRMFLEINEQDSKENPHATIEFDNYHDEMLELVKIYLASLLERAPTVLSIPLLEREVDAFYASKNKEKNDG